MTTVYRVLKGLWATRRLTVTILVIVLLLPVIYEISGAEMQESAKRCLYVMLVMALLWLTEALPIPVTALVPLVMFPMTGVMSASLTSAAYISDTTMLFLGGLIVAVAVEECHLHKRIAMLVIMLIGSDPKWMMAGLMLPTWFLSMWISNTATASMMIPIAEAVLLQIKTVNDESQECDEGSEKTTKSQKKEDSSESSSYIRLCRGLTLCIAYAANIGGIATLTGTPPNLILKGMADEGCCTHNKKQGLAMKKVIKEEWVKLGKITMAEIEVLILFIVLAVLWISRDPKESPGWTGWFIKDSVSDSTAAMLIALLLFTLPAKIPNLLCWYKEERTNEPVWTPLLTWEQVNKKLPWGVIILLGGGFALAKGVQKSHLDQWLALKLQGLGSLDPWVLNLVLCLIVATITEVTSNSATATLLMPILANLGISVGISPLYLMVSAAIATSFAFMLPVATPPNAIVFTYGYVRVIDMATVGIFMNIIAVAVLTLAVNTWGKSVYGFDDIEPYFQKPHILT
ncbi:unnamed protein product [Candidula unifasciata]|uniref:Citrate transporter-like domain-containing protein n=1 Tax=Candidula unifasciata TaxID=100452 RepID=A0A8S3YT26_9EUPU|nr:unnamed protein product [Candidula unifasciata]